MAGLIDVAQKLAKDYNVTTTSAKEIIVTVLDTIVDMAASEPIRIGKHSFKTVERKARKGRNPKTGESIDIPAKKVLVYKHSKPKKEKSVAPAPEAKKKGKKNNIYY